MFANTLTIPMFVDGDSHVFTRIDGSAPYSSEYLCRKATYELRLRIRHSKTKATASRPSYDRHNVEVVQTIYATASAPAFERKAYVVLEVLPSDVTDAACQILMNPLVHWLFYGISAVTPGATVKAFRDWES